MPADKIQVPHDPRVNYKTANLNGRNYGYLLAQPESGQYRATVILIHGFPDLSIGWRYQIPMLVNLGLRVVAPDCLGYGGTEAPEDITEYSHKRCADDIKELAAQLGSSKVILGGHDWGAMLAYRTALWHPTLVTHLFTASVPYPPPRAIWVPLEEIRKAYPVLGYQLQFRSGEVERSVAGEAERVRWFLSALYGGRSKAGGFAFASERGVLLGEEVGGSRLLSLKELDYYVNQFSRNGLRGPLNWYRTDRINHTDELALLDRGRSVINAPVLYIQPLRDLPFPARMMENMARNVPHLTRKEVDASHWVLWEKPEAVNEAIAGWIKEVVFSDGRVQKL